jgi:peptide/nickel transport system permease protein
VFLLGSAAGDPAERLASRGLLPGQEPTAEQVEAARHELGLDRPFATRYGDWLGRALHGDLGESLYAPIGVSGEIRRAIPTTAALALAALMLIVVLAIPLGMLAALYHRRWPDHLLRFLALAGASVPGFFLSYLLVYVFAVRLRLLPVAGAQGFRSVVLPAVVLAVGPAALLSRLLRSSLLEVLGEQYITVARAKGLTAVAVMVRHALRNAAIPVLTVVGNVFARLLEGAVIVEIIFSRPGIGLLTYEAVASADYPVIQGSVLFAGVVFIVLNLLVDLSYPLVDPQVRLGARA